MADGITMGEQCRRKRSHEEMGGQEGFRGQAVPVLRLTHEITRAAG